MSHDDDAPRIDEHPDEGQHQHERTGEEERATAAETDEEVAVPDDDEPGPDSTKPLTSPRDED
ncbi:hypothetical protein GCM10027446_00680 [Angustibacter peucedani]